MKKLGFTLAEVLISLGIVGVVASITLPTLVSSTQNQSNCAKLSATVATFEAALTTMITSEGVYDLTETEAFFTDNKEEMAGGITNFLKTDGHIYNSVSTIYPNGLKTLQNEAINSLPGISANDVVLLTKGGAYVYLHKEIESVDDEQETQDSGSSLYTKVANVVIDSNGPTAPNKIGRDIFCFILGANGQLYPFGGHDVDEFDQHYDCEGGDGLGCAAVVIKDGYKMNY